MIIGILGFGSIGKRHAKNLIGLKKVLIFDTNKKNEIERMGCKFISDKKDFVKSIDVGIICTPSQYHLHDIVLLINNHKDCFVEKPLSHEIIETKKF